MSELGYISNRYKKISRLTNSVNSASIAVKKHSMSKNANYKKKFPKLKVSEGEYIKARIELINFIDMLLKFFEEKTSENEISILNENTAFKSQIINNHELRQEVEILLKSLKKNQALNIEQFKPLDTLIGVLDNERSNLFRKMRNVSE